MKSRPRSLRTPQAPAFKAAVSFYPWLCFPKLVGLEAPLLILHGGDDVVAPAELCRHMKVEGGGQHEFVLRIYPGAGHLFDAPGSSNYNEKADRDAQATMKAFLARHLQ